MESKETKDIIELIRDYQSLRIYINDILHFEMRMANHDSVQSWLEGSGESKLYVIEFYRKEGDPIKLEYDNYERWKEILNLIDNTI